MDKTTWTEWLLAFAGISLMAVTAMAAIAAAGGWIWFYRFAKSKAEEAAHKAMRDFLAEANIRNMIREEVLREAGKLYNDMDQSPTHNVADLEEKDNE